MRLLRYWFFALVLTLIATLASAQNSQPDYDAWEALSDRAIAAIEAGRASNAALETLRSDIADYRSEFETARQGNDARLRTIRSQLDALGPAPEDGNEEPDLAQRRSALQAELARLQVPSIEADQAYTLADGLIDEIDRVIRERQAQELISLGPSPLNPTQWPRALEAVNQSFLSTVGEVRDAIRNPVHLAELRAGLPVAGVLFLMALVLIGRGRAWSNRFGAWLYERSGRGGNVWDLLVSLGRIVLPFIGVAALVAGLQQLAIFGIRGSLLLDELTTYAAVILIIRWLCERLFAKDERVAIIKVSATQRAEARWYGTALAVMIVLRGLHELVAGFDNYDAAQRSVLAFPLVVISSLILFRLSQILTKVGAGDEETEPQLGGARVIRIVGRIAMILAPIAPIFAALGYGFAGNFILYPTIQSLALLGFVMVLQRLVEDIYLWITGKGEDSRDALTPVLLNFVVLLSSVPFLALFWGVRVADLTELWDSFLAGFSIGETTISPIDFLTFVVVFAVGYVVTRLLQSALQRSVLPKTRFDVGARNAIVSGTGYLGIFLAALIAITTAGIDLSSLAIVAGALSVGIGFGLQNIVSNFVSGIILLIERPISEGDWIEVGGQMGYVRDISVRSTRIETFDRSDVIIPNADLVSGTVTNYTRGNTVGRIIVSVGVAYGTDTRRVEEILREIAQDHPMILANPAPAVLFAGFGASSLDFEIRAILRDVNWSLSVKSELHHKIAARFVEEDIEIPFTQTDIWFRNAPGAGEVDQTDAGSEADADGTDVAADDTGAAAN